MRSSRIGVCGSAPRSRACESARLAPNTPDARFRAMRRIRNRPIGQQQHCRNSQASPPTKEFPSVCSNQPPKANDSPADLAESLEQTLIFTLLTTAVNPVVRRNWIRSSRIPGFRCRCRRRASSSAPGRADAGRLRKTFARPGRLFLKPGSLSRIHWRHAFRCGTLGP